MTEEERTLGAQTGPPELIVDAAEEKANMATAGIFFCHVRSARIDRHYDRLVQETTGLVDWRFVYNEGTEPAPQLGIPYVSPQICMPKRFVEQLNNGGIPYGYLDTAIIPCALAVEAAFIWIMEYDVDFSGNWRKFFDQFDTNTADLLTTSIGSRDQFPNWFFWYSARPPEPISSHSMFRAFHPIMRISRRYADAYRAITAEAWWLGHYEFTLPTIAAAHGFVLEDIGGELPGRAESLRSCNYVNNPSDPNLGPGTFRWRPSLPFYFHEAPASFLLPAKLYHPIKADVPLWESKPKD